MIARYKEGLQLWWVLSKKPMLFLLGLASVLLCLWVMTLSMKYLGVDGSGYPTSASLDKWHHYTFLGLVAIAIGIVTYTALSIGPALRVADRERQPLFDSADAKKDDDRKRSDS
jgi:hypothetical protein